ncbi:MAG: nidogen-like domain-containing protein, partial [Pseudolabrys sp.]
MAGDTKTDFSAVSKSNNQDIDGILYGQKWSGDALTFSFPDTIDEYTGFAYQGFSAFSKEAQAAAKAALDVFSSVTDLTFTNIDETTTVHANLRFANSDDAKNNPTARGTLPGTSTGGDMYFNSTANPGYADPKLGSYDYYVTLHELGHALGLTHGHDDGLSGHPYGFLPHDHNSSEYSIMTYRSFPDAPQDNNIYARAGNFPQSLMQDDIAALQYMYGANFDHNSGDTVYTFDAKTGEMFVDDAGQGAPAANIIFRTVWDGGGEDTYDLSNYTTDLTIDLNPGASSVFSTAQLANLDTQSNKHHAAGNVYNALLYNNDTSSLIENAIGGSGNDKITGNQVDNKLDGMGGNDMLFGGDGNDRLDGGGGINVLDGGNGSDIAVFDHSGYYYTRAFNKADGSIKFTGNGEAAGEIDTVKNTENYAFDGLPNGITNAFAPKGTNTLPRNDDGYSSPIDVSGVFLNGLNFYGNHFDNIYVNNNGNITFTNGLSTYTPGSIGGGSNAIIAPFWGDVDTRPSDGGFVYYNADPTHGTFTATWQNVGYYGSHTDKLNSFQVELVDEGSGDFEIIFRYSNINWLTGDASGGSGGLGGSIARAGFSAGDNVYGHYFELPQSGNSAGMLNLESTAGNTGSAGAWVFRVSNGVVDGIGGAMDDVLNGNDKNNSIYGFGGNDTIDGKGGNDTLYGGDGNDTIIGGAGNDKMYGGTGDDTYIVSDPGDKVFESKGEGNDTVQAAINYVLP